MRDFLSGTANTLVYFIICAGSALILRVKTRFPDEPFRKLLPGSPLSFWLDKAGSAVVALYLVFTGVRTIRDRLKKA